ncbi:uncharacterized protein LOC129593211 [Paramacrobiotus metropolitanus]|uniref:uncharacterized protein LOC129593211 n=1 Tax=Paramacrobiotus metropolitanus TaxID=2943436 RepID=UPI00244604F9|nr:uncharacterized protein LOC129593211 [Paramacrobiotus metropolitanus]
MEKILVVVVLLAGLLGLVCGGCPRYIPNGRPIDNCHTDTDCIRRGWGSMCCSYCGANGCNRYCRGTGSNGDADIGGGNRRKRSTETVQTDNGNNSTNGQAL